MQKEKAYSQKGDYQGNHNATNFYFLSHFSVVILANRATAKVGRKVESGGRVA
jgi:hypothetical protein